jgi:hypothetical protein
MSVWDDPSMRVGGDFIAFNNIGDTVTGTVLSVSAHRWDDGSVCPKVILDVDGDEKTITAGQIRLKAALAEKRPETGDTLTITLTDIEKRAGGKTLKHFDVQVNRGGAAAAAPKSTPATKTVVDLDDLGLTAEQKAALTLLNGGK